MFYLFSLLTIPRFLQATLLLSLTLVFSTLSATEAEQTQQPPFTYDTTPGTWDFIWDGIEDVGTFIGRLDNEEYFDTMWLIAGSTILLVEYDQEIINESKRFATRLGLISDTTSGSETYILATPSWNGVDLPLRIPKGINPTLYYIGDGLTHFSIVGGLVGYGLYHNDNRALNTAGQIMESLLVTGTFIQILKRSTGRQSPFRATKDGGRWTAFPPMDVYNGDVSFYDAFPSGHIATAMATTTVLAANYPDHPWIKPTGYTAMGLLMFAMLNNEVHWASDYPLGIAIGWLAADIAIERGKKKRRYAISGRKEHGLRLTSLLPYTNDEDFGFNLTFEF
jgi:hypothetical protein